MDAGLPPVRMAVNVSALEFMAKDFLCGVRNALLSSGVEPYNLELELTETVLMQDAESAIETLNVLKSLGVQLAVDDFGTGYSSFSYLRKFPLDSLKVDRSFINEISTGLRQRHHPERADQHRQEPEASRGGRRRGNEQQLAFSTKTGLQRRSRLLLLASGHCRQIR